MLVHQRVRGLGLFLAPSSCIPGALSAGHSKVAGEPSRGGAQVTSHLGHRSGLQCKVAMEKKTTGTRPGKHTKNYGESPCLMGKSTINGHFQ